MQKTKSLHCITIDDCQINTRLSYNTKTNHNGIGTTYKCSKQYYINNKDKAKQYYIDNKDKIKQWYENNKKQILKQDKQDYQNTRDPNIPIMGSEEHRIKVSCTHQGISISEFDGFLTDQRYCKLWTESFRESIRERFHHICYLCGKKQGNRKLSVHHVNYNKSCLCGSNCEFVPLCGRCHGTSNRNRQMWENLIMNYLYPNRYFMVDL